MRGLIYILIRNTFRIFAAVFIIAGTSLLSQAADMGDSLIRDYPVALTLPVNRFELSADYLRIDDATDIFNIRDQEIENISSSYQSDTLSDMTGFRMMANYGLYKKSTLQSSFIYRDIDFGISNISIKSFDISWKQNILNKTSGAEPLLAIDFGFRYDYGGDQSFSDETDVNTAMSRFVRGVTMDIDQNTVRFITDANGASETYDVIRQDKPEPAILNNDMYDLTSYVRLTVGKIFGVFFPNMFAEFGKTRISSTVDFSFKEYIPEDIRDRFPDMPMDLDRNEDYIRTGVCLLWKYPYSLMGRIEYNYLKIFRDDQLDYLDDNFILKADLNWFITPRLIFNIGGVYYHWQFNGVIPFLYNEYTQTTFDHKYGRLHMGFTYLFGR